MLFFCLFSGSTSYPPTEQDFIPPETKTSTLPTSPGDVVQITTETEENEDSGKITTALATTKDANLNRTKGNDAVTQNVLVTSERGVSKSSTEEAEDLEDVLVSTSEQKTLLKRGVYKDINIVFAIGASVGVLATVLLVVAMFLVTKQYKRRKLAATEYKAKFVAKGNKGDDTCPLNPTVSVYTRSVFHTPLPGKQRASTITLLITYHTDCSRYYRYR